MYTAATSQMAASRPRVNFASDRQAVGSDTRGTPSDPAGALAGAGLGHRQTSRLASLYTSELDEEDDEDGPVPLLPTAARSAPGENNLLTNLLMQGGRVNPQALASLEMLRMIRELRAEDQRRRSKETDDSDLLLQGNSAATLGKAMAGMTRHRARIRDQPRKIVDEFRLVSKLELNIRAGESWAYPDLAKRISWGHYQGLQRCFILLANVLELLDQGQALQAQALTVQSMKAVHQAVLNNGSWKLGWPLTGIQDPLARRKFAGSASELELMADFVRAEEEVEKRTKNSNGGEHLVVSDGDSEDGDSKKKEAAKARAKAAAVAKKKNREESA